MRVFRGRWGDGAVWLMCLGTLLAQSVSLVYFVKTARRMPFVPKPFKTIHSGIYDRAVIILCIFVVTVAKKLHLVINSQYSYNQWYVASGI